MVKSLEFLSDPAKKSIKLLLSISITLYVKGLSP